MQANECIHAKLCLYNAQNGLNVSTIIKAICQVSQGILLLITSGK